MRGSQREAAIEDLRRIADALERGEGEFVDLDEIYERSAYAAPSLFVEVEVVGVGVLDMVPDDYPPEDGGSA